LEWRKSAKFTLHATSKCLGSNWRRRTSTFNPKLSSNSHSTFRSLCFIRRPTRERKRRSLSFSFCTNQKTGTEFAGQQTSSTYWELLSCKALFVSAYQHACTC
jgi:hypothetical protein